MPTDIKLEKFEGPLDLLLQLIEREELDITEVALSKITEQFLSHLDRLEKNRSEELADFLVIATRLLYMKSRNLLPYLYPEEDEGPSLADQLKLYKQYVEASKIINGMWEERRLSYGRIEPPVKSEGFVMPANAGLDDLRASMLFLIKRLQPLRALPKITIDRALSVKQKIDLIRNFIKERKNFSFSELLAGAESKTEVIVSFLALLELVKDKVVFIKQPKAFDEMMVERI